MAEKLGVEVACPSCARINRIPFGHLSDVGTCGACKASLPRVDRPIELASETDFDAILRSADVPVLVDYWAPWCGPCRAVAPELEKVARARSGRALILKVNTERFPSVGARQGVRSIPTMAVHLGGREIGRTSGARPAALIEQYLDEQLSRAA